MTVAESAPSQPTAASTMPAGVKPSRRDQARQKVGAGIQLNDTPRESALDHARGLIAPNSPPDAENADDSTESLPQRKGGAEAQGRDQNQEQALDLKTLAAKLELKPSELYATAIPTGVGDGETKTLGELKDFYRVNSAKLDRLENLDRFEVQSRTDRMTNIRDLDQLVQYLPPQALNPDFHREVQRQAAELARGESQKLLQVYPEWGEPVVYQAAQSAMRDVVRDYGFTGDELDSITDHRWIVALNDLAKLKGLQKGASAAKPVSKSGDSRPSTVNPASAEAAQRMATKQAAKKGDRSAQLAAARNLIFK